MSDNNSVGQITLDLAIGGDIETQINQMSSAIGTKMQNVLQNVGGFDLSTLTSSIDAAVSTVKENILNALSEIKAKASDIILGIVANTKNIGLPINISPSAYNPVITPNAVPASIQPRAPPIPKISTGVNMEALKAQIDNLAQSLDITNARMEQQQAKLLDLKEAYNSTFNETKKSKLAEQILQTEDRINRLAATSDKAGFKLADLDAQFETLSNATKDAASGIEVANKEIEETASKSNSVSNSIKKANSNMKAFGDNTKDSAGKANSALSGISRILDRMLIRMVLLNTVIKALTTLGTFVGNALMTNDQFANSLAQVKSNLEVAFMPIFQAILPALTELMNALAKVTTYLAVFISTLFGTTYQASAAAAESLNTNIAKYQQLQKETSKWGDDTQAAANKVKNALTGFDQINKLSVTNQTEKIPKLPAVNAPMPIVAPPVDTTNINNFAEKVKKILEPLKADLLSFGKFALDNFLKGFGGSDTINNLISSLDDLGSSLSNLWVEVGPYLKPLGKFWLAIQFQELGLIARLVINGISDEIKAFAGVIDFIVGLCTGNKEKIKKGLTELEQAFKNYYSPVVAIINAVQKKFAEFSNWLGSVFKTDWSKHFGFMGDILNGFLVNIHNIFGGAREIFGGVIDFITGIFTGNWSKAWRGVIEIFKGIFDNLPNIIKIPLNSMISVINSAISALDKISVKIPKWSPIGGGETFGFDIPKIPYLAQGGIVDSATMFIAGEAGKEAVMPLENNTGWISQLAGKIGSMIAPIRQPKIAFAPSGDIQSNKQNSYSSTNTPNTTARNDNKDMKEIIQLIQMLIDIIKNLKIDFDVDGTKLGKLIIDTINNANRNAGKKLIRT